MRFRSLLAGAAALALALCQSACVIHSDGGVTFARGTELAERQETLPLELASGEALNVELSYGDIRVRVAAGEAPRIEARWRATADDKATAEAVLARYALELARGDRSLAVRTVGEPLEVKGGLLTQRLVATADLTLVVPETVRLAARSESGDVEAHGALAACKLESSYGDLAASGVRGNVLLQTASGTVRVEDVETGEGGTIEALSSYGDITADGARAATIRLSTASGSVRARRVQGALTVRSSYGDLEVRESSGDLDATTSSGDIELAADGIGRRKLVTSYGDITVRGAPGELEAKTSSGEIAIEGADGAVRAESTYGEVTVAGRFTAVNAATSSGDVEVRAAAGSSVDPSWRVVTSYGDALLELPRADFSCELEAAAKTGEVECEGYASPDGKRVRRLGRKLGDGGALLSVASSTGDVVIRFR